MSSTCCASYIIIDKWARLTALHCMLLCSCCWSWLLISGHRRSWTVNLEPKTSCAVCKSIAIQKKKKKRKKIGRCGKAHVVITLHLASLRRNPKDCVRKYKNNQQLPPTLLVHPGTCCCFRQHLRNVCCSRKSIPCTRVVKASHSKSGLCTTVKLFGFSTTILCNSIGYKSKES